MNTHRLMSMLIGLFTLALLGVALWTPQGISQSTGKQIVVLTANWCASCRQVLPVVNDVARKNGLSVVTIDVDSTSAPREAKRYGISILDSDLPHVYLLKGGAPTLVLDGKNYIYGEDAMVRGQLVSAIGE